MRKSTILSSHVAQGDYRRTQRHISDSVAAAINIAMSFTDKMNRRLNGIAPRVKIRSVNCGRTARGVIRARAELQSARAGMVNAVLDKCGTQQVSREPVAELSVELREVSSRCSKKSNR